ncbi:MAG: glycosyltransferase family 87 protein [Flavobacteriales bacterium]|nr:glycosyltransferase family 87 protein [Flavobacteriales bacterium]
MMSSKKYQFIILSVLILAALGVSIQVLNLPPRINGDYVFTHYNNYLIFKDSFFHLIEGNNLYTSYPTDYWDLYKYSPIFSLFMGMLAWMPNWAGLLCWNLLNVIVLFFGVKDFDFKSKRLQLFFWFFIFLELITSLQNSQCNILIIGLFLLAYQSFQKEQIIKAALFLSLTVFIKIFGLVLFILFLLYPKKIKFISYSILWFSLLALFPIVITGWNELIWQYQNWWHMLINDSSVSSSYSFKGWLELWFTIQPNKSLVLVFGIVGLLLPLFNYKAIKTSTFQTMMFASAVIWVVIFNHKAESPTYIIAVIGAYIWFINSKRSWVEIALITMCFLFTIVSPTDIFPQSWREAFITPYAMKAFPCILIWVSLTFNMLRLKPQQPISTV